MRCQKHVWELPGEVSQSILVGQPRAAPEKYFRQLKFRQAVTVLSLPMDLNDSSVLVLGFIQPTPLFE
jgi:hypothetical protein